MSTKYESTNNITSSEDLVPEKSKFRTPTFIYVLTFLSTIGGFLFGYDTGVVSGAMLIIRDEFKLSTEWHECIVSSTIAAAWMFSLIGGWLTDKLGRKPVILLASIVFSAGSIIMGLANGKEVLLAGRIIVGIGIGVASMSVPVYIAESALPEVRGRFVTLNTIFITGGQFIASAVCGGFSSHPDGWRYMLGLAAVPASIQFFGFLGMPESPRWLVSKKKYDEALKVLRSIREEDFPIEEELESIKEACMDEENELQVRIRSGSSSSLWLKILTTKATQRALLLGCLLQGIQQLSGINTVMYYSASIIQMAGVKDYSIAIWLACATASVNFFCTFIGLFLVERVGRRPLTLWSLGGVVISLIILGVGFHLMTLDAPPVTLTGNSSCSLARTCTDCISKNCGFCYWDLPSGIINGSCWAQNPVDPFSYPEMGMCSNATVMRENTELTWAVDWCPSRYSWVAVAALGIYLLFFAPGMGPMPWTINSEIYPMWARSSCNSVATSTNWLFNLLISMTFLTLTQVLTREGAFYLYAGFAGLGLITLLFLLPETKGRSLEEMETVFSGPWCMNFGSSDPKNIHVKKSSRCDQSHVNYVL
ncbi:proton myo-inositol cotransporter isoform X2 [Cryptotermes secundus]|uniref:proton myo-inositol cotransporter isoform X2 n=1 Tax=Cryptotermes secundus TaxID=105785 RepID=UPI000CD7AC94|nr:proton myo-inositol cotransporter isoform X2 [Cryptotermes secundus]